MSFADVRAIDDAAFDNDWARNDGMRPLARDGRRELELDESLQHGLPSHLRARLGLGPDTDDHGLRATRDQKEEK